MRASRALLALLTLPACGGSNDGGSLSAAAQPSDPGATTGLTDTGPATAATASTADPTDTGPATSAPTTSAPTTSGTTSTTGTGDPDTTATDTTTTDTTTTGTDVTGTTTTGTTAPDPDTGTTAGDSSSGPGCPEGQNTCPCGPADECDPGLACQQGVCGPAPVCGDGKLDPGEQCDDGNQVNGDGCEKTCVKTPAAPKDACGFDSDGVWFQIDYSNANTVSSPSYSYSATPGWGEAQWAPAGKSWPYAVDLFNNASVVQDQIGKVALLNGTNKAVRVYFGLVGLNYTHATVCVEGRSYSVGSQVTFLTQEAKTKCGGNGSMAQDWVVHATGVDMKTCFIPGDSFQAVQVQPSGGSGALSLKRLRVTLHGATY